MGAESRLYIHFSSRLGACGAFPAAPSLRWAFGAVSRVFDGPLRLPPFGLLGVYF